jgi:paraquat-inducible protein B
MTDTGGRVELPTAGVHRRRRIPLIWIVPILTALIAIWLAWDTFSKKGPTITIAFDSAAGLTAGQSQLKYKNVVMGTVKNIGVSPDFTKVIVTIETVREAEPLLTDKTIFWVVKPELFAGSITGLETLISGSYIGMRPSAEPGVAKRDFIGKTDPPVLQAWTKGTTFMLDSKRLGSISLGSPIFYRDLEVGTVLGWDIGDLASRVTIHAFVRAPYDQYVHADSSFWNASGVSIKMGADGV